MHTLNHARQAVVILNILNIAISGYNVCTIEAACNTDN